ncbi:MAG: hypothetical protein H6747_09645 [Deltaproteobacteria bacterium]|nr:hypothetical protein [Deltaproteobacteria bacterium]
MRGRKAKANTTGPDSRSHKRQSSTATAFDGKTAKADRESKAARAKPPALGSLVSSLVKVATSSDAASKSYAAALRKVRAQGVTLDDVAGLLIARMVIVEDAIEHDAISAEKGLTELGRCNRELAELAAAYREQGRSLPDQIVFRLDLAGAVAAGEQPEDAPELHSSAVGGDTIETE